MVKKVWQTDGRTDRRTDRQTDGLNQSYSCLVAAKNLSLKVIHRKSNVYYLHYILWSDIPLARHFTWISVVLKLVYKTEWYTYISINFEHKDGPWNWNLSSWKKGAHLSCMVDTMAADGLATQGARTYTTIVFTLNHHWFRQCLFGTNTLAKPKLTYF